MEHNENSHSQENKNEATTGKAYVPIGNLVEHKSQALSFAQELLGASIEHFETSSKVTWEEIDNITLKNGCKVSIEAAPATGKRGPFQSNMMRAIIPLGGNKSPDEVYAFLISKEGFAFLDPDADPDDFQKALLGPYSFPKDCGGGKIQVEKAILPLPWPLSKRDYVILNAFSNQTRTFLSASCYSPAVCNKASPYDEGPTTKYSFRENVRMAIYGAYSIDEAKDESLGSSCVLKVSQYVDMSGKMPAKVSDHGNLIWFRKFIKRAQKRFPLDTGRV